jgi:hypothetical protein
MMEVKAAPKKINHWNTVPMFSAIVYLQHKNLLPLDGGGLR